MSIVMTGFDQQVKSVDFTPDFFRDLISNQSGIFSGLWYAIGYGVAIVWRKIDKCEYGISIFLINEGLNGSAIVSKIAQHR